MPRLAVTALAAAVAAALAPGCGDDGGADSSGPAGAIPPGAIVYLEADVSGEGDQHAKLDALLSELGEIPLLGTPVEPRDLIAQALEDSAADSGVDFSYAEDVEPWLGDSIALGFSSLDDVEPGFVASFAVDDEDIARDSLDRIVAADPAAEASAEYDGVSYYQSDEDGYAVGVFDEMLVLAAVGEFEAAVDASRGDSLADEDAVSDALGALPDERLASLFVDVEAAAESEADTAEEQADLETVREVAPELLEPVAAGAIAGDRSFALDIAMAHSEGAPDVAGTPKLAEAPSDSFAALGVAGLGEQVASALARIEPFTVESTDLGAAFEGAVGVPLDEVLAGIGDAVAYGRGELPDAFVAALDADLTGDGDAPERALEGLRRLAEDDQDTVVGPALGGGTGFSAEPASGSVDTTPVRFINAELAEGLQVLVASDKDAAEPAPPAETLGETERFQVAEEALSNDYEMLGFADLEPILDSVVPGGSILDLALGDVPPEQAIAGFLADKLGFAAVGVRKEGDYNVQRLLVGLR